MHCCCACLRMSRFPFPCCTGFWWILMSLMGSNFDGFSWIWSILGSKIVSKTFDLFFRGFGMPWELQKYCFTAVKHTFSQIHLLILGSLFGAIWVTFGWLWRHHLRSFPPSCGHTRNIWEIYIPSSKSFTITFVQDCIHLNLSKTLQIVLFCIQSSKSFKMSLVEECIHMYWFRGFLEDHFGSILGVLGNHFGISLVAIWCKGAPRRALECHRVDF